MTDTAWVDAELYELENADDPDFDLPFWRGLVQDRRPRRMLELACGTGRLSVPMAAAGAAARDGFELVGVDSSEEYLARARAVLAD